MRVCDELMIVIGITGGIAAGKSFVARELGRLGAGVIDADRLGHSVLRLRAVKLAVYQRWGDSVLCAAKYIVSVAPWANRKEPYEAS